MPGQIARSFRGVFLVRYSPFKFSRIVSFFPFYPSPIFDDISFFLAVPESILLAEIGKTGKGCKILERNGFQEKDSLTDCNWSQEKSWLIPVMRGVTPQPTAINKLEVGGNRKESKDPSRQ